MATDVKAELSSGRLDTANFMEQFALDVDVLLAKRLPEVAVQGALNHVPIKHRLTIAGERLAHVCPPSDIYDRVRSECDTIRAIGALAIGVSDLLPSARLRLLRRFADDSHFAVREWAWIGLRDSLGDGVLDLVPLLTAWAKDPSERVRRYSCEVIRPRGVWCRHLTYHGRDLTAGLPVVEQLRTDSSRYVQVSVGNWLNDACRLEPAWVINLCSQWQQEDAIPNLIVRRALRSVRA